MIGVCPSSNICWHATITRPWIRTELSRTQCFWFSSSSAHSVMLFISEDEATSSCCLRTKVKWVDLVRGTSIRCFYWAIINSGWWQMCPCQSTPNEANERQWWPCLLASNTSPTQGYSFLVDAISRIVTGKWPADAISPANEHHEFPSFFVDKIKNVKANIIPFFYST